MQENFRAISDALAGVRWTSSSQDSLISSSVLKKRDIKLEKLSKKYWKLSDKDELERCHRKIASKFYNLIKDEWPLAKLLRKMIEKWDDQGRSVGAHVVAVIASMNEFLPQANPENFFVDSEVRESDEDTRKQTITAHRRCWGAPRKSKPPLGATPETARPTTDDLDPFFGKDEKQRDFAERFLRVIALYHDIGKVISNDHHVTRGVHLMRDVNDSDRNAVESLFDNLWDKRCFWSIVAHHDIFGNLCTGEASLPALTDIIGWTAEEESEVSSGRNALAQLSFLNWFNLADSNASLIQYLNGITKVEAMRYLLDWQLVINYLSKSRNIKRDEFKSWTLETASRPDRTILRISRLIASCYRKEVEYIDYEKERNIRALVEEELQALHGPRFERFCYRFARFCKLDYALGFFYLLMRDALHEQGLKKSYANDKKTRNYKQREEKALRNMTIRTCAILDRIVAEYGHLVDRDPRSAPRLGVDMSKLTNPKETGESICGSLKRTPAGALWWLIDEIGIWLYGD